MDETAVFDVSREPVILNIYDMFWTNDYTANVGLGVGQMQNSRIMCCYKCLTAGLSLWYGSIWEGVRLWGSSVSILRWGKLVNKMLLNIQI